MNYINVLMTTLVTTNLLWEKYQLFFGQLFSELLGRHVENFRGGGDCLSNAHLLSFWQSAVKHGRWNALINVRAMCDTQWDWRERAFFKKQSKILSKVATKNNNINIIKTMDFNDIKDVKLYSYFNI